MTAPGLRRLFDAACRVRRPSATKLLLGFLLAFAPAFGEYVEIGEGGSVTTNRPFCGS
jgi:hypothetical protein